MNVVTLDETNNVIEQFVDDIITYANSGGLENLTANNVIKKKIILINMILPNSELAEKVTTRKF